MLMYCLIVCHFPQKHRNLFPDINITYRLTNIKGFSHVLTVYSMVVASPDQMKRQRGQMVDTVTN